MLSSSGYAEFSIEDKMIEVDQVESFRCRPDFFSSEFEEYRRDLEKYKFKYDYLNENDIKLFEQKDFCDTFIKIK